MLKRFELAGGLADLGLFDSRRDGEFYGFGLFLASDGALFCLFCLDNLRVRVDELLSQEWRAKN